jgi:hypothetical protein
MWRRGCISISISSLGRLAAKKFFRQIFWRCIRMQHHARSVLAVIVIFALLFTIIPALAAPTGTDIAGHWAEAQIRELMERGVVSGLPDGTFRPELTVTRAEFVTMVNKSLGLSPLADTGRFSDVNSGDWFAGQVEAAAEAGYVTGNPDGTFSPYRPITREQAAAMLIRAFGFARLVSETEQNAALAPFADAEQVSPWAKADMATAVHFGLISGYTNTTLAPKPAALTTSNWQEWEAARTTEQREAVLEKLGSSGLITRGQTAAILVRALSKKPVIQEATLFDQAGTYGPEDGIETISGDVIVTADGVVLQNLIITGDLTIAESVGDGTVVLDNVIVKGETYVKGGGTDSVIFRSCTLEGTITVEKEDGKIRIVVEGSTSVPKVVLQSGAILITQEDGSVEEVILPEELDEDTEVVLSGSFGKVEIASQGASVSIGAGSSIDTLVLSENATGTKVDLDKEANVGTLTANAPAEITGQGRIDTAEINNPDVDMKAEPEKVVYGEDAKKEEPKKGSGGGGGGGTTIPVSAISVKTEVDGEVVTDLSGLDNDAVVTVTLTTTTSGATIYYTKDGTTPTSSSTKYTEPFTVEAPGDEGGPVIVKAIGMRSGYTNSAVATKTITFRTAAVPVDKEITSVASIADISVAYGTELSAVGLPTTVEVTLDDETTRNLSVTWDGGTPAYDGNTAGEYVFAGTLTLVEGLANTGGHKAQIKVIVAEAVPVDKEITSVASIADISVAYGTELSAVGLPTTVEVTLDDETTRNLSVTCNLGRRHSGIRWEYTPVNMYLQEP